MTNELLPRVAGRYLQDPETPEWLRRAVQEQRAKYENDLFEAVSRGHELGPSSSMFWRIMCYDCSGKVRR